MRLYVWRSSGVYWLVTTVRKERYLKGHGWSVAFGRTHRQAFSDAWARTHPQS